MQADRWVLVDAGALNATGRVTLDSSESRHLATTLRARAGDSITLCDGCGGVAEGVLAVVDPRRCGVDVTVLHPAADPFQPAVSVALSVLHSQAMDWAVQKCVEVGVATLIPLMSERSQLSASAAASRAEHWRRVGLQALKQCHRPWQMEIAAPVALGRLVEDRGDRRGLLADLGGDLARGLPSPLPDLLAVGPEGGFAPDELELLRRAGWLSVRLGRWVLRAETAAVVGAAVLIAALGGGGGH